MKRILTLCLTLALLATMLVLPVTVAQAADTMTVKGGWLRLRQYPSTTAVTMASYNTGTVVTVLGTSGDWIRVRTPDGREGYMMAKYLTPGGIMPSTPSTGTPVGTATVVSSNGYGVKLRTGPSTGYGVMKICPVGTTVTILAKGTYWDYIRVGSSVGYMMNKFLSTGAVVPTTGYLARVTSENGLGVRLRTGPSTSNSIMGVYAVGTEVTVLNHGATWDYIRIGSRTGYMMNRFLTTAQISNKVTAVAINKTLPKTGDVLTASVTPAAATVTYQWTDEVGTLLGTGASYTVQSKDSNKRIRVTVTGTGLYTGSATSAFTNNVQHSEVLTAIVLSTNHPVVGQTITASVSPAGATADYWWYRSDGTFVGSGKNYVVQAADLNRGLACRAIGNGVYTGDIYTSYTGNVTNSGPITLSGSLTLPATAVAGSTLTATANLNSFDVTYSWWMDGGVISGNGLQITVPGNVGGKLKLVATATLSSGLTGTIYSGECTIVAATKPALTGIISMPVTQMQRTTLAPVLTGFDSHVTYEWYMDGTKILGSAATILVPDNVGSNLTLRVVATADSAYSGYVESGNCLILQDPSLLNVSLTGTVAISGEPRVGSTITADLSGLSSTNVSYQWLLGGVAITGETDSKLDVTADMVGKVVSLQVTGKGNVTGSATSAGLTIKGTALTGSLSIPASAKVGDTLTVTNSTNCTTLTYSWHCDGMVVGTGSSYTVESKCAGKTVEVYAAAAETGFDSNLVSGNACTIESLPTPTPEPTPTAEPTPT